MLYLGDADGEEEEDDEVGRPRHHDAPLLQIGGHERSGHPCLV